MSNTAWYEELKTLHKKPVKPWYRFITIVRCPVCYAVMDEIKSVDNEQGMGFSMVASDARRAHRKNSPSCGNSYKWWYGWVAETVEVKQ